MRSDIFQYYFVPSLAYKVAIQYILRIEAMLSVAVCREKKNIFPYCSGNAKDVLLLTSSELQL